MKSTTLLEGPWETVKQHDKELRGKQVRLMLLTPKAKPVAKVVPQHYPSARGLLAFLPEGSEQYAARKEAEITRER